MSDTEVEENEHFRYDPSGGFNGAGAIVALDRRTEVYMVTLERAKQVHEELGEAIERAEEEGHIDVE